MHNKKLLAVLFGGLVLPVSAAHASIEIISLLDRIEGYAVPNHPIVAQSNGVGIQRYDESNGINQWFWRYSDSHELLSTNLFYVPSVEDSGRYIELCRLESSNEVNVNVECSNSLQVVQWRQAVGGPAPNFDDYWSVETRINNARIYSDTEDFNLATELTYIGASAFEQNLPNTGYIIHTLLNQDNDTLHVDAEVPESADDGGKIYPKDFTGVNLGPSSAVRYCANIFPDSGDLPGSPREICTELRLVSPDTTPIDESDYTLPPTVEQFKALFPSVQYKHEVVGGYDFVFAPVSDFANSIDRLSTYCTALGPDYKPLTADELTTFVSSGALDGYPTQSNYWTSDSGSSTTSVPGGFSVTVNLQGDKQDAPKAVYHGFYMCKK